MIHSSNNSSVESDVSILRSFWHDPVGFRVVLHDGHQGIVTSCYRAKNKSWVLRVQGVRRHVPVSQVTHIQVLELSLPQREIERAMRGVL